MTKRELCERLIKLHEETLCVAADAAKNGMADIIGELGDLVHHVGDLLLDLAAPKEEPKAEEEQ